MNIGTLDESWRIQLGSPGRITSYSADELAARVREADTWHSRPTG